MRSDPLLSNRSMPRAAVSLLTGVLALSVLAGCIAPQDSVPPDASQPTAVLAVDRDERWAGESFTFDASGSNVSEGEIRIVRLDLGDGTVFETNDTAEAVVHHAYEQGGVYTVHLTVIAAPEDGENRTDSAQKRIAVHERMEGREAVLQATPVPDAPTASATHPFPLRDSATLWEVDVHLESEALVGASEVTLRILSPDNETLAEENVTLQPEANQTVRFSGTPTTTGGHALHVTVDSGSVSLVSLVRVYYDADA